MADKEDTRILLPVGRLINQSLFVKDQFNDQAVPKYKVEIAFDPDDVEGEDNPVEAALVQCAMEKWGEDIDLDSVKFPYIEGDKLAAKRERKGKPGDAYAGKTVLRADTIYNKDGQDGAGGVQVYNEEVEEVSFMEKDQVYQGCYGQALVQPSAYENSDGDPALKLYLVAFQKTDDGERLVTPQNHAGAFKPVGRKAKADGEGGGKRRARKG